MVALKAADVERFVARPDPTRSVLLVFGPDAGLVRERAEALVRASVDDPRDPFALVRLEGDEVAADVSRLVEEANTIPLFGGRRAVWVKAGSRNLAPAVERLLAVPSPDCRVVIEAGDLRRNAPLRMLCERSAVAATLPCYRDNERDLVRLVDEEMRAAGLAIAADARATLLPLLGADRQASRNEIRKLVLHAHGRGRVTLDDVIAVVADASAMALDAIVDAAVAGTPAEVEVQYAKTRAAGTVPAAIAAAALRQLVQLHKARLAMDDGASAGQAMRVMMPPVHFSRANAVEAALQSWTSERLVRAMAPLADAVLQTRRQAALADAIAHRAMMALAFAARQRTL